MFGINNCSNIQELNMNNNENSMITISPSLFLRLLEWAKEEAKSDVCLHQVLENIMSINTSMNMDMYDVILNGVGCEEEPEESMASDEDLVNAYDLGKEYAENGVELSSNGEDYSLVAGEIITDEKDNGYGASNEELEQFWQGYESDECEDCKLFDETEEDGLEALARFNQRFNIQPEQKVEEPKKVELSISSDDEDEIQKILKIAKF